MAKQTGQGRLAGMINDRYQIQNPDGSWSKFDRSGRLLATKVTAGPYSNVQKRQSHPSSTK